MADVIDLNTVLRRPKSTDINEIVGTIRITVTKAGGVDINYDEANALKLSHMCYAHTLFGADINKLIELHTRSVK